eukprot:1332899-Amorphochlora_amoeboformis.AAC.2
MSEVDYSLLHIFFRSIDPNSHAYPGYPTATLSSHVLLKGFQLGGFLALFTAPAYAILGYKDWAKLTARAAGYSSIIFTSIGGIMLCAKIWSMEDRKDGIEDRAYRIYYNQRQNSFDQASIVGATAGLIMGRGLRIGGMETLGVCGLASAGAILALRAAPKRGVACR